MRSYVPPQPAITPGPVRIQPKLTVNRPGDAYEREADAVAERVLRMQYHGAAGCIVGGGDVPGLQRQCAHCEEDEKKKHVQRKEAGTAQPIAAKAAGYVSDLSGGMPLSRAERGFFEPRMGHDFGQVRIHTDSAATQSARGLNAHAYTIGNHIVFGAGQYRPDTEAGKRLLAHELTHTVQQQQQTTQTPDVQRTEFTPWPGQAGTDVPNTRQTNGDIIEEQVQRTGDPNFTPPMPALLRFNRSTCELTSTSYINFVPAPTAERQLTPTQFDALKTRILGIARERLNGWVRIQAPDVEACGTCRGRSISVNIVVLEGTTSPSTTVELARTPFRADGREDAGHWTDEASEWTIWHELGHVALGAADEYPDDASTNYPGGGARPAERVNESDWSIMSDNHSFARRAMLHPRHYSHLANWLNRRIPGCNFALEATERPVVIDYSFLYGLGGFSGAGMSGMRIPVSLQVGIPLESQRRLNLIVGAYGDFIMGLDTTNRYALMAGLQMGLRYQPSAPGFGPVVGAGVRAGVGNFDLGGSSSRWLPTVDAQAEVGIASSRFPMSGLLTGGVGRVLDGGPLSRDPYFTLGLSMVVRFY